METQSVQAQTPSSKAIATTSNTTAAMTVSSTSGESSSGSFVQALVKVIEGQASGEQAEVPIDAAASIITAILPSAIANLISNQPTDEEIKGAIQQLIQVIQTMEPENLESLMAAPELQQWMSKLGHLLTGAHSSTLKSNNHQDVLSFIIQPNQLQSIPTNELVIALNRYLDVLENNPNNLIVQQLGSELKMLTNKLPELFPALTAAPNNLVEANKDEASKADKLSSTSTSNVQLEQNRTTNTSQNSGNPMNQQGSKNSHSQLLQRLAYVNHNVNTAAVQSNVITVVETPMASEALIMSVDAGGSQQEDITLTITQLTDSQKLATSAATEAKVVTPSLSAQEFAEEMTRFLVKNMSISQLNGVSEAKISLVPEHLGQVDVRISVLHGQITAHFIAESAQAKDLLELQLPQLRASLLQQGLQVDKLDVEQHNHLGNTLFQDQRQQQASQQFAQNGKKNNRNYDKFGADFIEEMDQAVRINRLAYGNTFNATA